ncbi:predicted nucleoside-diphosphate-sugar epimerases [Vibrio maritimus]|uniref:Predicted nucleoside-diphosphate-sugar epimerases n=1 Tax=Vibrio maritimus TaxID=990268 RepID=A0A090T4L2_9VIBR|nr:predicted nucleoside-diphosphate-sugar epimerases [Vibrio maritimus]
MKRVLVLGASGYVGSQLIPILLAQGYQVTAAARQIDYLKARVIPHSHLTFEYLDLADREATLELVPQFDLVYFLVHGMAHGHDFLEYELSLAQNFRDALEISEVKHVVYLSAIQPQTGNSAHLAARKATGKLLRTSKVPITELRAGVIIGPGSAAYEIMRDFVYNLPVLIAPKWWILKPTLSRWRTSITILLNYRKKPNQIARSMRSEDQMYSPIVNNLRSFVSK